MSPVSSMIVSARICPIPGTVLRKLNSALSLTRSLTVRLQDFDLSIGTLHHCQVGFDRQSEICIR